MLADCSRWDAECAGTAAERDGTKSLYPRRTALAWSVPGLLSVYFTDVFNWTLLCCLRCVYTWMAACSWRTTPTMKRLTTGPCTRPTMSTLPSWWWEHAGRASRCSSRIISVVTWLACPCWRERQRVRGSSSVCTTARRTWTSAACLTCLLELWVVAFETGGKKRSFENWDIYSVCVCVCLGVCVCVCVCVHVCMQVCTYTQIHDIRS